jgi:hypothetical protein
MRLHISVRRQSPTLSRDGTHAGDELVWQQEPGSRSQQRRDDHDRIAGPDHARVGDAEHQPAQ